MALQTDSPARPRLTLIWFLVPAIVAGATLALNLRLFESLPNQMPAHFNASGVPDRWEPKNIERMYTLPMLQGSMVILHLFIYFATTGPWSQRRYQWSVFTLSSCFLAVAALALLQAGMLFSVPYFGYLLWGSLLLFLLLLVWAIVLAVKTSQPAR